jgi:two-component system sensor histidine kinase PilS (NtrC family)
MSEDPIKSTTVEQTELHDKLKWLMFFRVTVATVLLVAGILVQFRGTDTLSASITYTFYPVAGLVFFLSILYVPILKYAKKPASIANSQALVDNIIITFVVYVSGGAESPLSFLYILTIVSSTIVSYGKGGFWAASMSSIFYGSLVNIEYHHVFPSMTEIITGSAQHLPQGALYNMLGNITAFYLVSFLSGYLAIQTKKAEEELREKKIDYQSLEVLNNDIVRNISSGLLTVDGKGFITSFNAAAEDITGYLLEEVYGKNVKGIFGDIDITSMLAETGDLADSERPRLETWFKRLDGKEYYLGFSISQIKRSNSEQIANIIFFQDLTTLKRMEKELRQADKLAAIGGFAASIAHEIRNPLASISGSIELLAKDLSLELRDDNKKLMDIVIREVDRLNKLIGEFLNYARPSPPKKRNINLNTITDETIEMIITSDTKIRDIAINNNKGDIPPIQADEGQLRQVIWNLIKNAADAINIAGEIIITTRLALIGGKEGVEFLIKDNGCGIADKEALKIFNPFYTSKEDGNGLGLSVVHSIVEAHGGLITLDSIPGEGSTFSIIFPLN